MLQVVDGRVVLTLNGKANYGLLVFAGVLLLLAVLVVGLFVTMPPDIALGGLFVWAVLCLVFHIMRQKHKKSPIITTGTITVSPYQFTYKDETITLKNPTITYQNNRLIIQEDNLTWQIGGFDDPKHAQVVQAVLQGKSIATRAAHIRINNSN